MKRTIKISARFDGVIPTGSYQNSRPGFSAEETFEIDAPKEEVDLMIQDRQRELQLICYENFESEAEKARIQKIKNDMKNFRFYESENGEYPSVTSILSYDEDFFCTDDELKQYASQGNLIDAEIRNFVKTGKWVSSKDLEGCAADRFILKKGSLQLSLEGWNFTGFLEKYPIKDLKVHEKPLFNHKWKYAGMPDLEGVYNDMATLISIKRTDHGVKPLIQDAAYARCGGMEHIKQIMVVEMKSEADGGNKQGFSKPSITTEIDKYFELFLYKRKEFTKVYGV